MNLTLTLLHFGSISAVLATHVLNSVFLLILNSGSISEAPEVLSQGRFQKLLQVLKKL